LHDGVPELQLEAEWEQKTSGTVGVDCIDPRADYINPYNPTTNVASTGGYKSPPLQARPYEKHTAPFDIKALLLKVLSHPNVCSRETVIRRYDHEVQGTSVVKPLMGEKQTAPCDAAVITPVLGESAGLVVSNGLCPQLSEFDPYLMAQVALDEAIRNAVCVGADPTTISVLDNFCWPDPVVSKNNPNGKKYLGMLVKACQGLYDATTYMGTPLISGKDSMKNDFDDGVVRLSVPPTLLISAMAKIPDINKCVTSDFKNVDDEIFLCSAATLGLAGSIFSAIYSCPPTLCSLNLKKAQLLYQKLHRAIMQGWVSSAHDLSDGGLAVALAESIIGSGLGASIKAGLDINFFAEGPAHIIVSVSPTHKQKFLDSMESCDVLPIGSVISNSQLQVTDDAGKTIQWSFNELITAWKEPLPFA
jgi:phosphoribosylformylglycinamidine (FGAM) synthase-like enzyme